MRLCQLGGWEKAGQRLVFLSPLRFRDELSGLYAGIQYIIHGPRRKRVRGSLGRAKVRARCQDGYAPSVRGLAEMGVSVKRGP